jgi:hypothetical protein
VSSEEHDAHGVRRLETRVQVSSDEPIDRNRAIQRVRDHPVYVNRYVTVHDDEVLFPAGRLGRYVRVVESHGQQGVAVLAECAGRFALVRTYRYPLGRWELGVPRGMGAADTDPAATAHTELVEELGGAPLDLRPIGVMTPSLEVTGLDIGGFAVPDAEAAAITGTPWNSPVTQPLSRAAFSSEAGYRGNWPRSGWPGATAAACCCGHRWSHPGRMIPASATRRG